MDDPKRRRRKLPKNFFGLEEFRNAGDPSYKKRRLPSATRAD